METLISKLQYKNYERGEFSSIEMRTAEETIQLIKDYPWDEQRHLASVELTCPSVTIEHYTGKFLKIGPHFGGKFCLYLSEGRKISEKIVQHLEDSFEIITDFYSDVDISKSFDRLFTIFRPKRHFVTASFQYTVTLFRVLSLFLMPILLMIYGVLFELAGLSRIGGRFSVWPALLMPLMFIFISCIGFRVLINYYTYCRGLYINLSKGHNNFYFGTEGDYKEYFKSDIISISSYQNLNHRSAWSGYHVFEIDFKNGEQIRFPNLLLSEGLFRKKFSEQNINRIHKKIPLV